MVNTRLTGKAAPAACLSLVTAGLLSYSQTRAFAWDEGYHLLAAQAILRGKRPYLDFCFPQAPLNACWNAVWMRIFGDTWRTAHAVAALLTAMAIGLAADYVRKRCPDPAWRTPLAIAAIVMFGLNAMVFQYGTVGQAYGICLFCCVASFRCAVRAVADEHSWPAIAAGFFAAAAANSSLLTAPVPVVLLIWIALQNRAGSRWPKAAAFAAGAAVACAPLLWLFSRGPRQTIFSLIDYQFRYRQVDWPDALQHDLGVMFSWLDSSQALLLGVLAVGGLVYAWKGPWSREDRAELYLCGWLAAAEIAFIANGHPNFTRYYLLAVPFLAILACAGIYGEGRRTGTVWAVPGMVCLIMVLALAKSVYEGRDYASWRDAERIAAKIREIHPTGPVLADDPIYFVLRDPLPPGSEISDSHKLDLPPADMTLLHVVSKAEVERQIRAGYYDVVEDWTAEAWKEENWIDKMGLPQLYAHRVAVGDAAIFWGRAR